MRSYLLIRADREQDLDAALSCGACSLVLDLGETEGKQRENARKAARELLARAAKAPARPQLYARVAPVESELIAGDLEALVVSGLDGVVLEQAQGRRSVQHLSAKLAVREAEAGLDDGAIKIVALATQTASALFEMGSYAGCSRRLEGVAFDMEPLRRALGAQSARGADGALTPPFMLARSLVLFAAKAANVAAIDAPFPDIADEAGLRADCVAAARDGFCAKMAAHPGQVGVIDEVWGGDEHKKGAHVTDMQK